MAVLHRSVYRFGHERLQRVGDAALCVAKEPVPVGGSEIDVMTRLANRYEYTQVNEDAR